MNSEPRVASAFARRTPLVALLIALGVGAAACGRQLTPAAQPDPAVQPVLAIGTQTPASPPPPIHTAELPPAPVPATFDVAALAEKVKPMVVNITTTQKVDVPSGMMGGGGEGNDPFEFFFGQRGGGGRSGPMGPSGPRERSMKRQALGTGFIIDPQGYVVTNEHVIHDADDVRVHLADEREFDADVVGRDAKLDIALLRLRGAKDLPAAPLGSSEQLRVGEYVLAVGNPFGLGHTVTLGIVSAKARSIGAGPYDDFIQTDASINPGNSGGPLFNWRGEVVGINAAIRAGANGIGFAIPIDAAKEILPQLREKGHVERGRLGLAFQPMTSDLALGLGVDGNKGALISDVEPGGAAARAGLRSGDVVLAVNGTTIAHAEELPRRVAVHAPGSSIKLTILRDKQPREITATLDAMPDDDVSTTTRPARPMAPSSVQPAGKLGIQIADAPGGGVRVDDVRDPNTVRDLAPGDVIVELNRAPVKDTTALRAEMSKLKPGSTAIFKIRRGKQALYAAVPVPAK